MNQNGILAKLIGTFCTMCGACCFAIGGSCGQYLFEHNNLSPEFLVPVRLFISGFILIAIYYLKTMMCRTDPKGVVPQNLAWRKMFRGGRNLLELLFFGIISTAMMQYSYYVCIKESNIAFATILAYSSILFVLLLVVIAQRRLPKIYEIVCTVLVIGGTFLICCHGDYSSLNVSLSALIYGLISSFCYAVYTVQTSRLMQRYPMFLIIGVGMVIGGIFICSVFQPWRVAMNVIYEQNFWLMMAGVIIIGTVGSFTLFMYGVKLVGSVVASIVSSVEVILSVFICLYFFDIAMSWYDYIGMTLIMLAVALSGILGKKTHSSTDCVQIKKNGA